MRCNLCTLYNRIDKRLHPKCYDKQDGFQRRTVDLYAFPANVSVTLNLEYITVNT